jgi:hypothetical protein
VLSQDLTRSQSELYAAFRAETLASSLLRLWARVRRYRDAGGGGPVERDRVEPLGQLEHLPGADEQARSRVTLPAA